MLEGPSVIGWLDVEGPEINPTSHKCISIALCLSVPLNHDAATFKPGAVQNEAPQMGSTASMNGRSEA